MRLARLSPAAVLRAWTLPLLALASAACGDAPSEAPALEEDIVGGRLSTRDQDAVVLVGMQYQGGTGNWYVEGRCTGTLVHKQVVLTALHCIGAGNYKKYTGLDGRGTSTCVDGKQTGAIGDYLLDKPTDYVVKVGADLRKSGFLKDVGVFPADKLAPDAAVKAWVLPENQCILGSDVVALVLDKPIENAPVATIRRHPVSASEGSLVAVGWGFTGDNPETDNTLRRRQRRELTVDVAGPKDFSSDRWDFDHRLAATEFRMTEQGAVCFGDSGGAILDASGALVGVLSRGDDAKCSQGRGIATHASSFVTLVEKALELL